MKIVLRLPDSLSVRVNGFFRRLSPQESEILRIMKEGYKSLRMMDRNPDQTHQPSIIAYETGRKRFDGVQEKLNEILSHYHGSYKTYFERRHSSMLEGSRYV